MRAKTQKQELNGEHVLISFHVNLHVSTSSCRDPCPVSQLAPSSSPLIPSASAPPSFSAAPALCRPDAWTERWDKKKKDKNKKTHRWHNYKYFTVDKIQEVLSRVLLRCDFCLRCRALLVLSELVGSLSLLLQRWETLAAYLLSSQTAFFRSQLQTNIRNPQSCFRPRLIFNIWDQTILGLHTEKWNGSKFNSNTRLGRECIYMHVC